MISVLPLREIVTLSSIFSPCAAKGQLLAANGMPASSFFSCKRLRDLSRIGASRTAPNRASFAPRRLLANHEKSRRRACADMPRPRAAEAPSRRRPRACPESASPTSPSPADPPAPITFGRVQPGNGRNCSRAPVASTRFVITKFAEIVSLPRPQSIPASG